MPPAFLQPGFPDHHNGPDTNQYNLFGVVLMNLPQPLKYVFLKDPSWANPAWKNPLWLQ
ncbi:hypothetical protein D3C80_703260 [compost metagenome]